MFTLLDKNKTNNPSLGTEPFFIMEILQKKITVLSTSMAALLRD